MIEQFPGYFRKTPEQIKAIWHECVFALDANVLLNLYRYSPATAKSSFDVLKKLKDRLWLPWQAALEFHENRLGVIDKQTRAYESTVDSAKKLLKTLENPREHPFVEADLLRRITDTIGELNGVLESNRDVRRKLLTDDPQLREISGLFKDRVGNQPEDASRGKQLDLARIRCEKKIPPGFRDSSKDGTRPFGDVLMWFELMDYAKSSKKDLVFVTDDAKNDWWLEISGMVVAPLPALVQEFSSTTGQQLLLYRPDRFFEHASEHLNRELAPSAVQEMRDQTADRLRRRKRSRALSSEAAEQLDDICRHLWVHKEEATQLVAAVNRLPLTEWRSVRSAFDVSPEIRVRIEELLAECRCLHRLLLVLHDIPAPGYHEAVAEIEKQSPKHAIELMAACRQLPDQAIEFVRSARPRPPERDR